jgi:hypothetical protein
MMVFPQEGAFLEAYDENGVQIGFLSAADPDLGFVIVYDDLKWDETLQKFKMKTMHTKRVYAKFTLGPKKTE